MVHLAKSIIVAVFAGCILIILARQIFPLPSLDHRTTTQRMAVSEKTSLGKSIIPKIAKHDGLSGVIPLIHGPDALAVRVALANAAEQTLDVQYYIWHDDASGLILLDALRSAAERGVRVRLLVDDNGTANLDQELVALNTLPNMEVRIFNPFTIRKPRMMSFLFDFPRLNRRMHNKSFTADGAVTIIGGRNVGDSYFSYGNDGRFFDLDVIAIGRVADDVSRNFDMFWASRSSYVSDSIVDNDGSGAASLARKLAATKGTINSSKFIAAINSSHLIRELKEGNLSFEWAKVQMVSDDPSKGLGKVSNDKLMIVRLGDIIGNVESSIDLVSAYFIPGDVLTNYFTTRARRGINIRILTNSQKATDVLPVHAGYAPYRADLLDAGVALFELKETQNEVDIEDQFGILGSSSTSLHAKTFTIDKNRIFIGSFNFDPRSANLNSEMGLLIESPNIANLLTQYFDKRIAFSAYQPFKPENGNIQWLETRLDGTKIIHEKEPDTTMLSRALVTFIGWLPVDWLL